MIHQHFGDMVFHLHPGDMVILLHLEEDKVILQHLLDMAIHLLRLADKEFLSSGNEVEP